MAGLDQVLSEPDQNAPETGPSDGWIPAPPAVPAVEAPSLPLYAAGAVITLSGILAANAALPEPDYGWMTDTLMLAAVGFLFSYGSRRFGIAPRSLDFGFAALALILLACVASGQLLLVQLLPLGADRPDLRLLSALVWGGTIWASVLRTDNRVVGTTVPAMAVLGMAATIDVNTPVLVCFGVFILTVIFLLIHQNYLQNRSRVPVSLLGSDTHRLLAAQFFQAGLCGLVVLLAGMVVIVPAQLIFSHLSLSQAIRHLAAIQSDPNTVGAVRRFSDDDTLAIGTGDAWSASADVVMRVTPSDGQPHYWRGRTYDLYTGSSWESSLENARRNAAAGSDTEGSILVYPILPSLTPGDAALTTGRPEMTAAFEVRGDTNQFYYADAPRRIMFDFNASHDTSGLQMGRDGRLTLVDGGGVRFPYQIVSVPPPELEQAGTEERLRQAGTSYPPEIRTLYLPQSTNAQPDDIRFYQHSVAEALQSLPANAHDPLDEAVALRNWVSHRCVYTLTPPVLPDDTDHVHAFLGDTRRGYCDMFASSLAVLCRTAGIPARLAVGFAPGDPDGASFNLRAEDKHAWTEIYFPGTGWIAFDATAGSASDGTVPTSASTQKSSWLSRLNFGLSDDWKLTYPLVGLILAIAVYVAKTELYDPWRTRRIMDSTAINLNPQKRCRSAEQPYYARLTQALTRLGMPRRPEETPDEYASRILPLLPLLEREWNVTLSSDLVSQLTAAFTLACYGDPQLSPAPAQAWDSSLSKFESAARRIARARFWQRVTHLGIKPVSKPAEG